MQPHAVAKYVLHGLMTLMMLVQPVLPVLAMTKPEDAAALLVSDVPEAMVRPSRAADARVTEAKVASPLVDVAQQRVAAQEAYEAPTPVAVGEVLAAGTIRTLQTTGPGSEPSHQVYLPLVRSASAVNPPDIALKPEVWRAATEHWQTYELGHLADLGIVTIRYPSEWYASRLSTMGQGNGLSTHLSETLHVIVEPYTTTTPVQACANVKPYADVLHYQATGEHNVQEVTIKGLSSWRIEPIDSSGELCQEIGVALPKAWVRFQLRRDSDKATCPDQEILELVIASLQIRINDGQVDTPTIAPERRTPNQVNWMNYDRQAAKTYQDTYCGVKNNSDGYYHRWNGIDMDGIHYLSHVLQAGGFPIHWNASPQQNHSDIRVLNTEANRAYVQGFSNVNPTSRSSLKISDIIYVNGGSSFCWGMAVQNITNNTPYISTHSIEVCNGRYDLYYCGSSTGHWYEYNHIDATEDHPADPKLNSGLTLNPSTQSRNENVNATFRIHNYGGRSINLSLRVTTNGGGDFSTVSVNLAAGADYNYNKTRSFNSSDSYNTCAQMNTGSGWRNIPTAGSGVACRTLTIRTPATPKVNSGISLNPSTQAKGGSVTASFNVHNYGDESITLQLRARAESEGNFTTKSCALAAGGNCSYSKSRTFNTLGSYRTCAQMSTNGGSTWSNIPPTGSGVTCMMLNIVEPASVTLSSDLTLTPNEFDHNGGIVRAQFTVQNIGEKETTERFRANVISGPDTSDFATTADQTLNPGDTFTYNKNKTFSKVDLYEVVAEHKVGDTWTALIGNGSGFVRVKAPPPPKPKQTKGRPPTCAYAGEPVNTATGNYFYDFTDLSDPTPGLPLAVTRWYNALDADAVVGPFGHGTSWTYNMTVTLRADKSALVRMPDGHLAYFLGDIDPDDPTNLDGDYAGQDIDTGSTLVRSGDTAVLTTPDQTSYHFDAAGRVTRVTVPTPATITVAYSDTHPVQLVHSAGVTYTLTYSGALITGVASSNGRAVTYTYTLSDDLAMVTRPDGSTYTYGYDAHHRLTEARQPNGHAFVRNVYDDAGRVVRQYDQTGKASAFTYGAAITQNRIFTDALGHIITHTYDSDYRLIHEVDALGHTTVYTRDAAGNVLARRDKDGAVWRYTYDGRGNMLTETDPLGSTWTYTYDARNNRTSQTDPLGHTWTYQYDANGRLTLTRDPLHHTHEYQYDADGNLIWESDAGGAETTYSYNALGLQTAITDTYSNTTRMAYDAFGNQTVYTDANGNAAHFVYDDLNRLVRSIDPLGHGITFTYDAMGNLLTESDELGHLKHYVYDEYDRIVAETDFAGHTTRYAYDALGRRTAITDALGHTTVMTYNTLGQLAARRAKDGAVTRYIYDAAGRLVRETDPLSRTTEYIYDTAGRQIEVRRPCDACARGVAVARTRYDAAGRPIEEEDPRGATTQYAYDALGRLAVVTDTYGHTQTYTYDANGRVIQQTDQLGAVTRYEYDLLGQLVRTTDALGYQTSSRYDAVGRQVWTMNARGYTTTYTYDANDQLVATSDALGNVTRNTYDAAGRLIATADPLSRTTTYTYDANGNRLTETNPRGHTTTYGYDTLNRVVEVIEPAACCSSASRYTTYDAMGRTVAETNALGHTTVYTYDIVGRKIAQRSPLGHTTVYTYDVADNLIARTEPFSPLLTGEGPGVRLWHYAYDANGNQIRQTDPLGHVRETEYDLLNRAVRETDPLGARTTRTYDAAGRVIQRTDARGARTRSTYDALGRTVRETTPLGYTRVYTYDANSNVIAEQNARGFVTTYVYDALDRQIAQIDPLGNSYYTIYDAAGQILTDIDYNGNATQYAYDAAGNQIAVTDALSHTTTTVYDAQNRPVAVTNPLSHTVHMAYDAVGRVISETLPNGAVTTYTYDAEGREIVFTDPLGYVWRTEYDAAGRPIREIDPLGRAKTTTYNALGQVVARTDALARTTRFDYDPVGRLLRVQGPDNTAQTYTYDPAGNLLSEQDGNGHTTRYEYDMESRQVRKTNALGQTWRYRYDAAGNLLETHTPSGHTLVQRYDALGRLVEKVNDGTPIVAYAYDANGNRAVMTDTIQQIAGQTVAVTTYVYDALNQLVASTDPEGWQAQYTYDAAGQRTALRYRGASTQYTYDENGNLHTLTGPDGATTTYHYDALGHQVRVDQANSVVVATAYDAVGNPLTITQRDAAGQVFARHAYTVDAANRRVQETERLGGSAPTVITTTYTYDTLDRLVASTASDGTATHYAFDDAGNRLAMWGVRERADITETYRVDYAYNAANQLTRVTDSAIGETVYTYNADGARVAEWRFDRRARYTYDAESHLTEARVETWQNGQWVYQHNIYERYVYDGNGRRIIKESRSASDGGLIRQYIYRYDDVNQWNVIHQTTEAMAATTHTDYVYDHPMHKLAYKEGDMTQYFQNDALGSVLGTTDADGNAPADLTRYGDYGELDGPENALPTDDAYTGYERDAYTGLYYARNRYYDAATGTFLSVDPYPIKNQADLLDLHRYLYVQADPINRIDPQGLFLKELFNKAKEKVRQIFDTATRIFKKKPRPRPKPDIKPRPIPAPDPNQKPKPISASDPNQRTERVSNISSKDILEKIKDFSSLLAKTMSNCGKKPSADESDYEGKWVEASYVTVYYVKTWFEGWETTGGWHSIGLMPWQGYPWAYNGPEYLKIQFIRETRKTMPSSLLKYFALELKFRGFVENGKFNEGNAYVRKKQWMFTDIQNNETCSHANDGKTYKVRTDFSWDFVLGLSLPIGDVGVDNGLRFDGFEEHFGYDVNTKGQISNIIPKFGGFNIIYTTDLASYVKCNTSPEALISNVLSAPTELGPLAVESICFAKSTKMN